MDRGSELKKQYGFYTTFKGCRLRLNWVYTSLELCTLKQCLMTVFVRALTNRNKIKFQCVTECVDLIMRTPEIQSISISWLLRYIYMYCYEYNLMIYFYWRAITFLSHIMMMSSNGNIVRDTGHLCGEFTGPRWIPRTKARDAELWYFFDLRLIKRLSKQSWGWWCETLSCPLWRHGNAEQ